MSISEAQLNRVLYSGWDFQQALSALTFLMEACAYDEKYSKVDLRRFRCFESTAIISFARPFETSRGRTSLGLRELGLELSKEHRELKEKLLFLRKKIVAHSDEEEMHFRVSTFIMPDSNIAVPNLQFDEGLNLLEEEVWEFEKLLHFLKHGIYKWLFELAQTQPDLLNMYKKSARMDTN